MSSFRQAEGKVAITDAQGKFAFEPLAKGKYVLMMEQPQNAKPLEAKLALITIGRNKAVWDVAGKQPYVAQTAKAKKSEPIVIESNGVDPLTGICETAIVKSKSNITNN